MTALIVTNDTIALDPDNVAIEALEEPARARAVEGAGRRHRGGAAQASRDVEQPEANVPVGAGVADPNLPGPLVLQRVGCRR